LYSLITNDNLNAKKQFRILTYFIIPNITAAELLLALHHKFFKISLKTLIYFDMVFVWIVFLIIIFIFLALDLGVFHKKNEAISMKDSLFWTAVWITLALLFSIPLYFVYKADVGHIDIDHITPSEAVVQYITGYLIEKSLSLDNIFVIALIFGFFKIPLKYQHRILFWGIIGAVVFRGIMILVGASLIRNFHWVTYVFGAILLWSAYKMLKAKHEDTDFKNSSGIRLLSKFFPISWELHEGKFLTKINGKTTATLSLACLIVVEFSDILFAVDSIPAIFAITTDPFIVFTSNIFAILGLRSLYFFLANILDRFQYLKYSLIFILFYVGIKMLIVDFYKFPALVSLIVIIVSLTAGVLISINITRKQSNAKSV
jgi:tellurite resistance protein TerC